MLPARLEECSPQHLGNVAWVGRPRDDADGVTFQWFNGGLMGCLWWFNGIDFSGILIGMKAGYWLAEEWFITRVISSIHNNG